VGKTDEYGKVLKPRHLEENRINLSTVCHANTIVHGPSLIEAIFGSGNTPARRDWYGLRIWVRL